uniref:Putative LOV domain-containing protein n=1 Tax=Eriocapitella hupehensis TaxID=168000 RepID=A0A140F7Q6_9MAGN|nr:putative LOV domain-containing protein [Anemone hupehensis]
MGDVTFDARYSNWIREALDELPDNFTITDPSLTGHPIVFASRGFLKMCGYSRNEVIGKNGRIFQGPRTDRRSVMEIREAIREERNIQMNLLNYRKDGTPFWMLFSLCPVYDKEEGRVVHFLAVQVPIGRRMRRGSVGEGGSGLQEIVFGSCRREVCNDSIVELSCVRVANSENRGFDAEESCQASDVEKQKAAQAVKNILSLLSHYSELSGRLVRERKCCSVEISPLSSSLILSLGRIKQSFVLIDAKLDDMPIVYASDAFLKMTGYTRSEVLGHNCRFLDGPDTDTKTISQIRESIQSECACSVRILNYRKDGCTFWNFLHISPIRNASGKIAFYAGVQIEEGCTNGITDSLSPEMRQLSAVGAIKVAVRSASMFAGSSRS